MASDYLKQTWANGPSGGTPLSATRLAYIEDGIEDHTHPGEGGGPGGGRALLVAASDSHADTQTNADYVCDGTDDQVEIEAAYADLATSGGVLFLSEGTFSISAEITVDLNSASDLEFRGVAAPSPWYPIPGTVLQRSSGSTESILFLNARDLTLTNILFDDASSDPTSLVRSSNGLLHIRDCAFNTGTRSIEMTGTDALVDRCYFSGGEANVHIGTGCYEVTVKDCYFWSGGASEYCVEIATANRFSETLVQIRGCHSDGNSFGVVRATQTNGVLITDNVFYYDNVAAIVVDDCSGVIVSDNVLGSGGGILVQNIDPITGGVQVVSNMIYNVGTHGIDVLDSNNVSVMANHLANCGATVDTVSGIILRGDTNDCLVQGNKVSADGAAFQYGIRVDAGTCDTNMIYGNDLKGCATTATFSDAGTGTVTTAGNRT